MWDRIEPLMPADPVCGRRWADHRRTLEAIAWKYRTCSPWRDLPGELGSFQTAHKCLIRWAVDGTWERVLAAILAVADADGDVGWTVSVDSTVCRAHQRSAGARKKGFRPARARGPRAWTLSWWLEHKGPLGQRQQGTASVHSRHGRPSWRRASLRGGHGRNPNPAKPTRQAKNPPCGRPCGSRLLLPRDPWAPPSTRHPCGHPAARRPGRPPPAARPRRRPAPRLQRRGIQGTQYRRAMYRPTQAVARPRNADKLAIAYQAALHLAAILIWTRR